MTQIPKHTTVLNAENKSRKVKLHVQKMDVKANSFFVLNNTRVSSQKIKMIFT